MYIDCIDREEVIAFLKMKLISTPTPYSVETDLKYRIKEPYSVCFVFNSGNKNSQEWTFGRDLLLDSLMSNQTIGIGDVKITTVSDEVIIELSSPSGFAKFSTTKREMLKFIDRTLELVPSGSESGFLQFSKFDEDFLNFRTF